MSMDFSSPPGFDELEIRIFKEIRSRFRAELILPNGERVSTRLSGDPQKFLPVSVDPHTYGRQLYDWLFQGDLGEAFQKTVQLTTLPNRSAVSDVGLRIRLWLDPDSKELHCINWETLWEPDELTPMSMHTVFSRFLRVNIPQNQPVPDQQLRMLVFTASPQDLPLFDISNTLDFLFKTVKSGYLRFINRLQLDMITEPATLDNLINSIGENVRIVHLFAQSTLVNGRRCMILADQNGTADMIPYETIAKMMTTSKNKMPDLVFISAPLPLDQHRIEMEDYLGPVLINNGAQAVVTIEAAMDSSALNQFTIEFYRVLSRTGVVDEAVARARASIYATGWNWSTPVLYTRTQDNVQIFQQISEVSLGNITGVIIDQLGG